MRRSSTVALVGACAVLCIGGGFLWWGLEAPRANSNSRAAAHAPSSDAEPVEIGSALDEGPISDESAMLSEAAELREPERSEVAQEPAAELDATLANAPRAHVRGTLVDARTRELLPRYLLRFHDRVHVEDVVTDAQGRFGSSTAFLLGRVRFDPLDHPRRARPQPSQQVELELELERNTSDAPDSRGEVAAARELALEVASGPTFFLDVTPKERALPEQLNARLELFDTEDEQRDRLGPEPLRAGDTLWVRFPPGEERFSRALSLDVQSLDGVWSGAAKVQEARGVRPGLVTIALAAQSAVAGHVRDAQSGEPVAEAIVVLQPEPPGAKNTKPRSTRSDAQGAYHFDFVPPARYTLATRKLRYEVQSTPLELVSGQASTLDVALALQPPAGSIRGEVSTVTGFSTPKARIVLSAAAGERGPPLKLDANWTTTDGRKVARFEFPNLPAGSYKIGVEKDDWFRWEGVNQSCSPPREDVRLVVHDDVILCDYVFSAVDFDNGLALGDVHVWFSFRDGPQRERMGGARAVLERGVPIDREFTWRADRAGYASQRGDQTSFVESAPRDGRIQRTLEVALKPGWGDVVRAVRADGKGPVADLEVFVDGRSAGKTSKDGTLRIDLRDRPKSITIDDSRWRLQAPADTAPAWKRKDRSYLLLRLMARGGGGGKPGATRQGAPRGK